MSRLLLGAILLMNWASIADARTSFIGTASVIDGDTIEIHGQRIRLFGVDAPESRQTCVDAAGRAWRCGQRAALEPADLVGRTTIHCEQRDRDRYRRIVARCSKGGEDLGRWMVGRGWAVASRGYSNDYIRDENAAQRANRGIWASRFEMPWDWRAARRGRSRDQADRLSGSSAGAAHRIVERDRDLSIADVEPIAVPRPYGGAAPDVVNSSSW